MQTEAGEIAAFLEFSQKKKLKNYYLTDWNQNRHSKIIVVNGFAGMTTSISMQL